MNDYTLGTIIETKAQPLVDFNYNKQKNRNPRKSMFQIFSPKKNSKNIMNNNPNELFAASNNINSILTKNLKSIYKENMNEINHDAPLYENVNCLIQKNTKDNRFIFNQMLNFKNRNSKFNFKDTSNTFISNNSEKDFRNSTIIQKIDKLKKSNLFRTSIKNNAGFKKELENIQLNKPKNLSDSIKNDARILKKIKREKGFSIPNKTPSVLNNFKFKRQQSNNNEPEVNKQNTKNRGSKFVKDKKSRSKRFSSQAFDMFRMNSKTPKNRNSKNFISNKMNNLKPNFSNMAPSLKKVNDNKVKFNSKLKDTRHAVFLEPTQKDMKLPTIKQIKKAVAKTLIESKIEKTKKELEEFNKNEISEIIEQNPIYKNAKKKVSPLTRISLSKNIEFDTSEKNILLKETIPLKEQIEIQKALEEDRFQKKYRKLFLNKNLYDSLDDEEVIDQEDIYHFHISPNSFIAYILDTLILIASFIELYYLPVYISLFISPYRIYYNIISSTLFYIIDFIYIIDLITSFFRAYYNFEEVLIKKKTVICYHYLTGWFIFDLIEAIPFFTLLDKNMENLRKNFLNSNEESNNMFDFGLNNKFFGLTVFKLLKIFKTFTNNRVLNEFNRICDKIHFFNEWKGLFSTLIIMFSSLHFCTCFFIFIGKNESQGWILKNDLQDRTFFDIYIASLYYQMTTLTTVGYGDISATIGFESIYGIFILIVGTCAYSFILTYISNYIKKNNEKYIDFEEKMKVLSEIQLDYPNLDKSLYDRLKRYLNYTKSEHKLNLKFILESLPSSIQNNLIIEIYKPIIKNFQFFKSFENSDFFVKIVTSLKPILSMKDDILIREGDIIEDIIFIKNGVLTLEIIIDLNEPKKSVESHLEMTTMECFKNISNNKFTALMNLTIFNSDYNAEFGKRIFNNANVDKKEIKIIDLRKNEHFGDILMILNEKSPVAVKVKSKKAELFFLQKTEATEISNRYSNIWKRIVNRSLHNMKQIKNLIRKKVFLFIETNNIEIDQDLKERYLKRGQTYLDNFSQNLSSNIGGSQNIDTILEEEDESDKNINQSTKEKTQNVSRNQISNIKNIKDDKNQMNTKKENNFINNKKDIKDKDIMTEKNYIKNKSFTKPNRLDSEKIGAKLILKNMEKNKSFKEEQQITKLNKDINGVNEVINIIDKEVKISNKANQINNFNINIFTPKVQFPLNEINIENQSSFKYNKEKKEDINNSYNIGEINSEISYNKDFINNNIKDNVTLMNNSDENNNLVYSNIKFIDNKTNKNTNVTSDNPNSNIIKLFQKRNKELISNKRNKTDIKTNYKTSFRSLSSGKSKINLKKQYDLIIDKNHKYINLNTSQSTSFSINSSYDNINKLSKYKYITNSELREKTQNFILEQISNENNERSNKNLLSINFARKPNPKKPFKKNAEDKPELLNLEKNDRLTPNKKAVIKNNKGRFDSQINFGKSSKKIDVQVGERQKSSKKFFPVINEDQQRNLIKKKPAKKENPKADKEKEKTFFNKINRMKTLKKRKDNNPQIPEEKSDREYNSNKMNYDKLISKNIEKNQQNLNNPEEYFQGFFNDIILKKNINKSNNISEAKGLKRKKSFNG